MIFGSEVLAVRDLHIRQGSDTTWAFGYSSTVDGVTVVEDFVGWTARCQIRKSVGGEVWASVTPTLTASANKIRLAFHLPASVTEAAVWNDRNVGVYDVELVRANGSVIPLAAGRVVVSHDVTRL